MDGLLYQNCKLNSSKYFYIQNFFIRILAICEQTCENGGWCVAPNQCQCPIGLTGTSCKEDINECLLSVSVHKCGANSRCVNKLGWYVKRLFSVLTIQCIEKIYMILYFCMHWNPKSTCSVLDASLSKDEFLILVTHGGYNLDLKSGLQSRTTL